MVYIYIYTRYEHEAIRLPKTENNIGAPKHVTYSYLQALGWDSILSWLHHRHLLVSSDIKVICALHMTWIMFRVYLCIQCHTYKYKQMSKDCTRHYACTICSALMTIGKFDDYNNII